MPRADARVTRARLLEVAVGLLDTRGSEALTLSAVASALGVRTPSLYHHVDGLEGLRQEVRVHGIERLGDALQRASSGRAGPDALSAVARAYVAFGRRQRGLYELTLAGSGGGDERADAAAARVVETVVAVLRGYGLEGQAALHATRFVRSALHGFMALEWAGGFGLPLDTDVSLDQLIDAVDAGLVRLAAGSD